MSVCDGFYCTSESCLSFIVSEKYSHYQEFDRVIWCKHKSKYSAIHLNTKTCRYPPLWMTSSLIRFFSSTNSAPSLEARNRRERCWFILARGAWLQENGTKFCFTRIIKANNATNNALCLLLVGSYHPIDGHIKNSPGPHDIEQSVNIFKNGNHHFIFIFGGRSVENTVQSSKNTCTMGGNWEFASLGHNSQCNCSIKVKWVVHNVSILIYCQRA